MYRTVMEKGYVHQAVMNFGERLNFSKEEIEMMDFAVRSMDAGLKIMQEGEDEKTHPTCAYDLFKDMQEFPKDALRVVVEHHERSDGSGYPYGLLNDDISYYSKVVILATEFVKRRFDNSQKETIESLIRDKHLFDKDLLLEFISLLNECEDPRILSMKKEAI